MPDFFTYDTIQPDGAASSSSTLFTSLLQVDQHLASCFGGPTCFWYGYNDPSFVTRHVPRRATWREREQAYFDEGLYEPPIWSSEPFWTQRSVELIDHFAHVSLDDPEMIAFTEGEAKGEADRQVRMKPGRYLKRFFGDALPEKRIAYLAEWFVTGAKPPIKKDGGMALASTAKEIVAIYRADISSCMTMMSCVRVYGAGDLAVAYWRDTDDRVRARCLCWPSREVFGRTFPEPSEDEYGLALKQAMQRRGWVYARVDETGFEGARITKALDRHGDYVMPYLDLGYGVDDAGAHWVMSAEGDYECERTDGVLGADSDYWTCDCCGGQMDEDHPSHTVFIVIVDGEPSDERQYCEGCEVTSAYFCHGSRETIDDTVPMVEVDGVTWARPVAESCPTLFYDEDSDIYSTSAPVSVEEGAQ